MAFVTLPPFDYDKFFPGGYGLEDIPPSKRKLSSLRWVRFSRHRTDEAYVAYAYVGYIECCDGRWYVRIIKRRDEGCVALGPFSHRYQARRAFEIKLAEML